MSEREVGVQLQGTATLARRLVETVESVKQDSLNVMRPGIALVDSERGLRLVAAFGSDRRKTVRPDGPSQQRPGEQAVGLAVAWCDRNCLTAQPLGFLTRFA